MYERPIHLAIPFTDRRLRVRRSRLHRPNVCLSRHSHVPRAGDILLYHRGIHIPQASKSLILTIHSSLAQPVTGCIIAVFPPANPPVVPNTENVFEGAILTFADYIVTVPLFVEVFGLSLRSSRTAIEFLTGMGARAGEGGSHAPHPWAGEMTFRVVCPYLSHGSILGLRWRGPKGRDRRCFSVTRHLVSHRVRLVSCNPLLQQVFH